ncbi:MAG: ribbon-helix-helix protein, CopG family [Propionibacteriaceae bacterium]|nr:ribbon-helix-helix protein, CopG family [Propionibacteriaceae bacterium]
MPDVLIRGLTEETVERLDSEAAALGLSRNEYLRRKLESDTAPTAKATITPADWSRAAEAFADLADPSVMDAAWR